MNDIATTAREAASHCEAKKHALRQTQDGIVVAFVLHPNDVPAALQLAPLGTRYMLALVEIGEDETPKERMIIPNPSNPKPAPAVPSATPARARSWDQITFAEQTGVLRHTPLFQRFVAEKTESIDVTSDDAAEYIRRICRVTSCSEIRPGTEAEQRWNLLISAYRAWARAPAHGAA